MSELTTTRQRDLAQQHLSQCVTSAAVNYWAAIQNAKNAGLHVAHSSSSIGTEYLSVSVTRMGKTQAKTLSHTRLQEKDGAK